MVYIPNVRAVASHAGGTTGEDKLVAAYAGYRPVLRYDAHQLQGTKSLTAQGKHSFWL
jgi:hypothetical protein